VNKSFYSGAIILLSHIYLFMSVGRRIRNFVKARSIVPCSVAQTSRSASCPMSCWIKNCRNQVTSHPAGKRLCQSFLETSSLTCLTSPDVPYVCASTF